MHSKRKYKKPVRIQEPAIHCPNCNTVWKLSWLAVWERDGFCPYCHKKYSRKQNFYLTNLDFVPYNKQGRLIFMGVCPNWHGKQT